MTLKIWDSAIYQLQVSAKVLKPNSFLEFNEIKAPLLEFETEDLTPKIRAEAMAEVNHIINVIKEVHSLSLSFISIATKLIM